MRAGRAVGLAVAVAAVAVVAFYLVRWLARLASARRDGGTNMFDAVGGEGTGGNGPHVSNVQAEGRFIVNNGRPTTYGGGRCRITLAPATPWTRGQDVDVDVSFGSGCYSKLKGGSYTFYWTGDAWKTQEHQNAYMRMFFETVNGRLVSTLDSKYRSPWTFRTVHEYRRVRDNVRFVSGDD